MILRPVNREDLEALRVLNESVLPHVNSIPISDFEDFMLISSYFIVAEIDDEIAAFLIVLGPGQNYQSENYIYYENHYSSFDYVDRIVVGNKFQGNGIGKALYEYLIDQSKEERITCEVNLDPPNPGSILFHEKMGFRELAQQIVGDGEKLVSLMSREKSST